MAILRKDTPAYKIYKLGFEPNQVMTARNYVPCYERKLIGIWHQGMTPLRSSLYFKEYPEVNK